MEGYGEYPFGRLPYHFVSLEGNLSLDGILKSVMVVFPLSELSLISDFLSLDPIFLLLFPYHNRGTMTKH